MNRQQLKQQINLVNERYQAQRLKLLKDKASNEALKRLNDTRKALVASLEQNASCDLLKLNRGMSFTFHNCEVK